MFYNAKGHTVFIRDTTMDYVEFGRGTTPLIILPGLSDGLKTVKGQAINLAFYFREFLGEFRIYVFSRKVKLDNGCTTQDMAQDLKIALDQIGIEKAYLMGVSQGGMIAQCFTIDYPNMVEKLIIVVSASQSYDTLNNAVNTWVEYAKNNDYKSLIIDTLKKTYSPKKLKYYRLAYPLISRVGKPKDFSRFIIQADAVLKHDTYKDLNSITCPTLIVGGDSDKIVGPDASKEMAKKIPNNHFLVYKGLACCLPRSQRLQPTRQGLSFNLTLTHYFGF